MDSVGILLFQQFTCRSFTPKIVAVGLVPDVVASWGNVVIGPV
jgi:hypothetical protein